MNSSDDGTPCIRTGIDLRSSSTICAISNGTQATCLHIDGERQIPTQIEIDPTGQTQTGVFIGNEATGEYSTVLQPLPWQAPASESASIGEAEVSVATFLRALRHSLASDLPSALSKIGAEKSGISEDEALERPVLTVPGSFTATDIDRVEDIVSSAGFESPTVLRRPLSVAVTASGEMASNGRLLVIDAGDRRVDSAIVDVDKETLTYDIRARSSTEGIGRRALDDALAEWVLEQAAENRGVSLEYGAEAVETIRPEASKVISTISNRRQTDSSDDISEQLSVSDIPLAGSPSGIDAIDIDQEIRPTDLSKAFAETVSAVTDEISALVEKGDIGSTPIDEVVTAGRAAETDAIARATEGAIGRQPRELDVDTVPNSAIGAAFFAVWSETDGLTVQDKTLDRGYGIVCGDSDASYVELLAPGVDCTTSSVQLSTTVDNQQNAHFSVVSRHPDTGAVTDEFGVEIGGIPPKEDGAVSLGVTLRRADETVDVDVTPGDDAESDSLLVALDPDGVDDSATPSVATTDETARSTNLEHTSTDSGALATRVTPTDESAFEELDVRSVIDRLFGVRNDLARMQNTTTSEIPLEEIDRLLRKFDNSVQYLGVEPIDPDIGTEVDGTKHQEVGMKASSVAAGAIAEIPRPGYRIDDYVAQHAQVVVSKGPPADDETDTKTEDDEKSERTDVSEAESEAEAGSNSSEGTEQAATSDESATETDGEDQSDQSNDSDSEVEYRSADGPEGDS